MAGNEPDPPNIDDLIAEILDLALQQQVIGQEWRRTGTVQIVRRINDASHALERLMFRERFLKPRDTDGP